MIGKATPALVVAALLSAPLSASADFLDVIRSRLNDGCAMETYLGIVNDFNAYYDDKGYQTEIVIPLHSEEQGIVVWVGRSASAGGFGEAYDHWNAELVKDGSTVNKLSARFDACTEDISRASYETPPQ